MTARDRATMSDIDTLLAKFETGALLRPSPRVPNLVDLAHALALLAGPTSSIGDTRSTGAAALAALIGPAEHLVFIVADGLGMSLIDNLPGSAFLTKHLKTELRTVFPSATAVVLTSLATGAWPGQHGVTGQWTHLPEIRATADLLRFAARTGGVSLAKLGVTVEQAFPLPALARGMRRDTLALFPERVVITNSAAYFSGGRARRGYRTLAEATEVIGARVDAAPGPTYTSLYTPWIDLEAHRHGVRHPGVRAAVFGPRPGARPAGDPPRRARPDRADRRPRPARHADRRAPLAAADGGALRGAALSTLRRRAGHVPACARRRP